MGGVLLQSSEDSALVSAADWVQRSRKIAEARKEEERLLAEQRRRMLEEEDEDEEEDDRKKSGYGTRDLEGLKVAHGSESFREGEQVGHDCYECGGGGGGRSRSLLLNHHLICRVTYDLLLLLVAMM